MGDDWGLEDKLLRQNIPGRYKQWDRDSDEEEGFRKDEESEEEEEEEVEEEPQRPATLPEAMRYGEAPGAKRAGAKGQLAQYRYFKQMQYQERMAEKAEREAVLIRIATGAVTLDDSEDDEFDDDEFVKSYSEKRIQNMAARPTFGAMRRHVDKHQYLSAIEKTDPRVIVVVHLSDPRLPPCRRVEALLGLVAQRQIGTLFVSMTVDEAGQSFDPEVMPVIALYQNGEVVDTLFEVTAHLHEDDQEDLDALIRTSIAPFLK